MRKTSFGLVMTAAVAVALAGCSSSSKHSMNPFAGIGAPYYKGSGPMPKGTGKRSVGRPYQVAGRWFTPREQPGYDKVGLASWYGEAFNHRKTSNGEWFEMNDLTAAHPTLPLPSYAKVTNLENGRQIIVRINDRGPFVGTRIMDLSKRSANVLGFKNQGTARVRVQYLGDAPLRDDGRHLMAMNRELGQGASFSDLKQLARGGNLDTSTQVASNFVRKPVESNDGIYQQADDQPPAVQQPAIKQYASAYVINAGTFEDSENAAAASTALSAYGAAVVPVQTAAGLMYRVQIGPIGSSTQAAEVLQAVHNEGFIDARAQTTRIQQVASN